MEKIRSEIRDAVAVLSKACLLVCFHSKLDLEVQVKSLTKMVR